MRLAQLRWNSKSVTALRVARCYTGRPAEPCLQVFTSWQGPSTDSGLDHMVGLGLWCKSTFQLGSVLLETALETYAIR